jgi:hypothetical protein
MATAYKVDRFGAEEAKDRGSLGALLIVEDVKGDIGAESSSSESRVWFTLPV